MVLAINKQPFFFFCSVFLILSCSKKLFKLQFKFCLISSILIQQVIQDRIKICLYGISRRRIVWKPQLLKKIHAFLTIDLVSLKMLNLVTFTQRRISIMIKMKNQSKMIIMVYRSMMYKWDKAIKNRQKTNPCQDEL